MRKNRIGIFLSLLLLIGFTSCTGTEIEHQAGHQRGVGGQ